MQRDFGKRIRATHVARLPSGGAPEPGQVQPPSAIGEPAQILLTRTNCCQVPEPIPGGTCQQSVYGATGIEGTPTWQLAKPLECCNRPRDSMDKASAYGAGDCRSESCRGHFLISRVFTTLWATWYPASDTRHEVRRATVVPYALLPFASDMARSVLCRRTLEFSIYRPISKDVDHMFCSGFSKRLKMTK